MKYRKQLGAILLTALGGMASSPGTARAQTTQVTVQFTVKLLYIEDQTGSQPVSRFDYTSTQQVCGISKNSDRIWGKTSPGYRYWNKFALRSLTVGAPFYVTYSCTGTSAPIVVDASLVP